MPARLLSPVELRSPCDPALIDVARAPVSPPQDTIVGQDRAREAVTFGISMRRPGYHVFVMGPPGTGRRSLARQAIAAQAGQDGARRHDWVYVHNFDQPYRPRALRLAPGRGAQLRNDMRALVDELRTTIPAAFDSEEYAAQLERLRASAPRSRACAN